MSTPEASPQLSLPRPPRNFSTPTPYLPVYCDRLIDYFESAPLIQQGERLTQIVESDEKPGRKGKGTLKREVRAICAELPTFEKFASSIGCSSALLVKWCSVYPDWREAYTRAQDFQRNWLYQTGLSDRVQPQAWEFVATNATRFQLRRQQTLEVTQNTVADPRPELAKIPAQDLELMRDISKMLAAGLTEEDRAGLRSIIATASERAMSTTIDG